LATTSSSTSTGSTPPQWNVDAGGSWATAQLASSFRSQRRNCHRQFLARLPLAHRHARCDKTVPQSLSTTATSYTIAPGSAVLSPSAMEQRLHHRHLRLSRDQRAIAFAGSVTKTGGGTLTSPARRITPPLLLSRQRWPVEPQSNAGTTAGGSAAVARLALSVNNSGRVALGANQDLRSLDITTSDPGPSS